MRSFDGARRGGAKAEFTVLHVRLGGSLRVDAATAAVGKLV